MSSKEDYIVNKLIKKIQVLLTEPEFEELNTSFTTFVKLK